MVGCEWVSVLMLHLYGAVLGYREDAWHLADDECSGGRPCTVSTCYPPPVPGLFKCAEHHPACRADPVWGLPVYGCHALSTGRSTIQLVSIIASAGI